MRNILLFFGLVILFSCNTNNSDSATSEDDTTYLTPEVIEPTNEIPAVVNKMIWSSGYDSVQKKVILKQLRQVSQDTLSADKIISDINSSWVDVKLQLLKSSHDTLYVFIPESTTLTQNMGSSGAYNYIASVTYSLTELKGIKYVNYAFTEGDHLAPGTMKRSDFNK
ncbi:hypothetical protein BH11BAC3_BH11BAC3_42630 [soil metagenome]